MHSLQTDAELAFTCVYVSTDGSKVCKHIVAPYLANISQEMQYMMYTISGLSVEINPTESFYLAQEQQVDQALGT